MRSIPPPAGRLRIAVVLALTALSPVAHAGAPAPRPKLQPLVVRVDDGGFRWGDAGIGAAAGFGAALVLAGSLVLAGRRDRVVTHPQQRKEQQP
jgi:hypothetical protein